MKTKTNTDIILKVMHVVAWIAFIGLMVKAGSFLFGYGFSIIKPLAAKTIGLEYNFYSLYQHDFVEYSIIVLSLAIFEGFRAYTAYLVVVALSKIKLTSPFTPEVSKILEKIAYFILLAWILAVLCNARVHYVAKSVTGLEHKLIPQDFILMAGIVFVFSQIFKKGVEIQTENDLTI